MPPPRFEVPHPFQRKSVAGHKLFASALFIFRQRFFMKRIFLFPRLFFFEKKRLPQARILSRLNYGGNCFAIAPYSQA